VLQEAHAAQQTPEQRLVLRDRLLPQAKVERKITEVLRRHGLRRGRYHGRRKTDLEAVFTATVVNTKRLLKLVDPRPEQGDQLRRSLTARALGVVPSVH